MVSLIEYSPPKLSLKPQNLALNYYYDYYSNAKSKVSLSIPDLDNAYSVNIWRILHGGAKI